jgi:hypothetical protein
MITKDPVSVKIIDFGTVQSLDPQGRNGDEIHRLMKNDFLACIRSLCSLYIDDDFIEKDNSKLAKCISNGTLVKVIPHQTSTKILDTLETFHVKRDYRH